MHKTCEDRIEKHNVEHTSSKQENLLQQQKQAM